MLIHYKKVLFTGFMLLASTQSYAGAYIFAEENGVNLVTHPNTYFGNPGVVNVRVCIDPNSPDATLMEYAVQNNVDTYNQLQPTLNNLKAGANNNIPASALDFESVALHEIGHCLGMAHINAASESGFSGNDQNYTKATKGINTVFDLAPGLDGIIGSSDDVRGDDQNLVWFRKSNNDPFTIDSVIDSTTYSRNLANLPAGHSFAANADRAVSTLLGHVKSEAVMQQGTYYDEAQRTLGHDDVATLRYAESGLNEKESDGNNPNAQDNYTIVLEYAGITTSNCNISLSMTSTNSLAFCTVEGAGLSATHVKITTATIEFGEAYNWFYNAANTAPVLTAIANQMLTEGDTLVLPISATDAEGDVLTFSAIGLPAFASLIDHNDGTATLTISPQIGDALSTSVTLAVADTGNPVLSDEQVFGINVVALDTDGDGISDYDEIYLYGTSAIEADTDGDGLTDYQEIFVYLTSAIDGDSDNDFIGDGVEVAYGSNPLDALDWPNLADGDIAPLGNPDGLINAADYLVMQRIVLGELGVTSLELSHGDLYPVGAPDGVINTSDLILLLKLIQ